MSDIKELIQLVRYDENLQQQEYPIDLCDAASAELAALEAVAKAARNGVGLDDALDALDALKGAE